MNSLISRLVNIDDGKIDTTKKKPINSMPFIKMIFSTSKLPKINDSEVKNDKT